MAQEQNALEVMQEARRKLRTLGAKKAEWLVSAAIDDYLGMTKEAAKSRRWSKRYSALQEAV